MKVLHFVWTFRATECFAFMIGGSVHPTLWMPANQDYSLPSSIFTFKQCCGVTIGFGPHGSYDLCATPHHTLFAYTSHLFGLHIQITIPGLVILNSDACTCERIN